MQNRQIVGEQLIHEKKVQVKLIDEIERKLEGNLPLKLLTVNMKFYVSKFFLSISKSEK